jgi:hypothetical protein
MSAYLKTALFAILAFPLWANSQIIDACFTSPTVGTSFASTANVSNNNADCIRWDGTQWLGDWPGANINLAPPSGAVGTRAIWQGDGSVWTSGGEGFGLRLGTAISTGTTYSWNFTRVSHGTGSGGAYQPRFYTNTGGSFGYLVGNIPVAGSTWFTGMITMTATASQNGHTWIYFHSMSGGGSGMFLACEAVVLPMEMKNIKGWNDDRRNIIEWETSNDVEYTKHIVERSMDGAQFERAGEVDARQNHAEAYYSFSDNSPSFNSENISYYRIKSVHINGNEAISPIIEVERSAAVEHITEAYPNPAQAGKAIHVGFNSSASQMGTVSLVNMLGETVFETQMEFLAGINRFDVETQDVEAGIYFLEINTAKAKSKASIAIMK